MEQKRKIRILIADDHQMFIDGLKSLLHPEKDIEVTAQALRGDDAYDIICKQNIDLLISDISMPGLTGIELTKKVKEKFPEVKVLVVSMYNDREIVSEILMAEADGYILKNTGRKELLNAIYKIADNNTYYSNEILSIMLEKIKKEKHTSEEVKHLSGREIEILKLIMQECSSEEIAEKLFISKSTVDSHRKNILEKTRVKTIVGLCKFAFRYNLAG
ncbi:MAG: response regulator transcription factor [Bacteroidetes bacterium]|nr:MAG: response regulator transcription factor [Bacteroidota bacterium]